MRNVFAVTGIVALSGCASLSQAIDPTIATGRYDFDGSLTVRYEVNQQYYLDRKERDCIISLTLINNSDKAQKPQFTLYLVKGGNTFAERFVYFPTAFAGGTSQADITLRNIEMGYGVCKELTSNMKASLKGVNN